MTAGALLFTASANDPSRPLPDGDGELSAERHVPFRAEPVDQARTVPADVSLDQIEAVLERAENLARRQGPDFSPTVAQAAAELGMLYTTYQVQRRASGEQAARQEVVSAVPVSAVRAAAGKQVPADGPDAADAEIGRVTYDQVVVAAVRLASMLDQTMPGSSVDVQRTDEFRDSPVLGPAGLRQRAGSSLRSNLLDIVSVFGTSTLGYANGRIPAAVLCPLRFAPGHMLRCDAAERLTALSKRFEREFGYPIPITDSYRSYVEQIAVAAAKPHLAAVPGTSNHGWGLAVDLSDPISGGTSREYAWLRVHGPDHGWDNPSWARPGGTKPEPWHFEFFAAGSIPDRAVDPSDVGGWGADAPSSSAESSDPHSIPALDPSPGKDSTASRPRPPATPDEPSVSPPSQKPAKPGAKPKPAPSEPKPKPTPKPTPSDPAPKPTTPPATPSPTPTPSPSEPGQEPPASPSPTPVPTPSEPSEEPSVAPSAPPTEASPSPDPAPSSVPSSVAASSAPLPDPATNTDG
ncbi:M15 family metallopeptidase [Promicromonospora iranensis]|uniref:M15 family metallopeptidase n=1 Tax=Promicromonospora iranensis TaxID=1105144 RepID=UPI0023A91B86|nr:D-alanyl-D-alanine carboxypeptidase family protein [Promicromonospora iranensis]